MQKYNKKNTLQGLSTFFCRGYTRDSPHVYARMHAWIPTCLPFVSSLFFFPLVLLMALPLSRRSRQRRSRSRLAVCFSSFPSLLLLSSYLGIAILFSKFQRFSSPLISLSFLLSPRSRLAACFLCAFYSFPYSSPSSIFFTIMLLDQSKKITHAHL